MRSALESVEARLDSIKEEIQKETDALMRDDEDRQEQETALEAVSLSEKDWTQDASEDVASFHENLEKMREELNAAKIDRQKKISAYRESALRLEQITKDSEGVKRA